MARVLGLGGLFFKSDDPDGTRHVILVSQYRVPLGRFSLEIPAGLIGDDEGKEGEDASIAAARELEVDADDAGVVAEQSLRLGGDVSLDGVGQLEVNTGQHD